jgi:hypothetical protein
MIIAGGPSTPASQTPSVLSTNPSSLKSTRSSPKYQTEPSSAWA